MKKIVLAMMAVAMLSSSALHAQDDKHCYTTEIYNQRIKDHPELLDVQQALEEYTQQSNARTSQGNHTAGVVYIIPIVFHVLQNYGSENVSDAQVFDEVRILNDDYRKRSYDTASIIAAFKPVAADCEIEFRLATLDPNGNCTNGIDRITTMLTYSADDNSKLNPWPADQYLNVWVALTLANSGAAAYAYYPGTAPLGADGVIMLGNYVGSIGSGSVGRSRVLTHEIGHYLNLKHVWGNTNNPGVACGDDNVFDTPLTKGWRTCPLNGSSCGNTVDNVQNYMEYSYCCNMFTEGQKSRMRSALTSSAGGRDNLWTSGNLVATGTDGSPAQVCTPVTDFRSNRQAVCAGGSVQYSDLSWNANPTSWSWNFPGGTPATSTDSMPIVQYNTPGFYDVGLTTGNSAGSDSLTKTSFIAVTGSPSQTLPYYESFETAGSFPGADGYVLNPDGGNTWVRVTNAASTGTASIMINNFSGNTRGEMDEYITPSIDFSNVTSLTMDFKVAHAQRSSSRNDGLEIYASINCGQTWTLRYSQLGYNLATSHSTTSAFVPNAFEWRQEHVSIIPYHNQPNVRFKFRNTSDRGNNIYIDDINISGIIAGIHENVNPDAAFSIFPNPSSGNFFVTFLLEKNRKVNLKVTDALGRDVKTLVNAEMQRGEFQYPVDENLDAGIYFVVLEKDGEWSAKKVVITQR